MKFNDFIVSEEKVRLDPKCWTGKKIGNPKTKMKGGVRVNNCVPAESVEEAANPAQQAAIAIAKKKKAGVDEAAPPGAKAERMVKHIKKGYAKDGRLSDKEKSIAYATAWKAHNKGVTEGTQRVDSLVTDALRIMQGSQASDAVAALKTVLGDREYNSRRGYYNFYVRQLMDMSGQQGVAEGFNGEYDDEAGMAQGNLYTIAQAAQGLLDTIDHNDNLPEWAQEKIAKVEGMLVTVWNYLQSQKAQGMDPKVAEGEVKPFVIPDDQTQGNYENQGYRKNPQDQFAVIDYTFNKVILTTNDIKQAKQEAIEWAEYDDIPVAVKNQQTNKVVFKLNGYADAEKYLDESSDPEIAEMYEAMQNLVTEMAQKNNVSEDAVWEQFEAMPDNMLYETAAWRRKEGKSAKGGLNAKGVASYRRENPGSKLQTAVTTKPSKLKPGSKAAKRRKSFCARMGGVKGPMKKPNGKPTRKALALRKWNC